MSFVYTVAQLKDLSVLVDLQSRLFLEEASIAKALDINEALYKKYVTLMLPLSIRRTMTYIALDQTYGKITGLKVDLPQALSDEELPAFPNEISQFIAQTSAVFKKLERPLEQYAAWRKGKSARTMFIGVDKPLCSSRLPSRAICRRLPYLLSFLKKIDGPEQPAWF